MVEYRTRDPEFPSFIPSVANRNSHRSNQNNTMTNPSAPKLNTNNVRGDKQKSLWYSGRVED